MTQIRLLMLLCGLLALAAGAQAPLESAADAKPADHPLISPLSTYQFVKQVVQDARATSDEEQRLEILRKALIAFDSRQVDPTVWEADWANYVVRLVEIMERLDEAGVLQPTETDQLPDKPTGTDGQLESFGINPVILVLERIQRTITVQPESEIEGETKAKPQTRVRMDWVFSPGVVRNIPRWHAGMEALLERIESEPTLPPPDPNLVEADAMVAPYATLKSFLEFSSAAAKDGGKNWEAARAHMDFFGVAAAEMKSKDELDWSSAYRRAEQPALFNELLQEDEDLRIGYVEALSAVLDRLIGDGIVDPETITREADQTIKPTWAVGDGTRMVILVRQGDEPPIWRFSAQTVADAPAMAKSLEQPAPVQPVAKVEEDGSVTTPAVTPAQPVIVELVQAPEGVPLDFSSPRATLSTFWDSIREGDMRTARSCMDLTNFEGDSAEADQLAGKLWLVMTRRARPLESQIPNDYNASAYDLLVNESGRIRLERKRSGDQSGHWLFTARTLRDISRLYRAFETEPVHEDWKDRRLPASAVPALYVREYIVPAAFKQTFRGLDIWQWLGVLAVFAVGLMVQMILALLLPWIGGFILRSPNVAMLPHVINSGFRPTATLAMVLVWLTGMRLLDLGNVATASDSWFWSRVLDGTFSGGVRILQVVAIITGARAVYMLVDVIMGYLDAKAAHTKSKADDILVPLVQKTMKFVIVALGGILTVKYMFELDVLPIFASLGIGGFAIAFAAQDAIKNFFGSLSLAFDQPFRKGDWVIVSGVEGTIERVGLRSCRIRTFYKSQVSVPNGEIMNAVVDNMGRRTMRRIKSMISVTYDTKAEALEAFVEGIRELIRQHPHTNKESYHVYVNQFASSSIDILLYCFVEVPDWGMELRERQRLFIDIMRLAERLGIEFAFPTQTLHMYNEEANPNRMDHVPHKPFDAQMHGKCESKKIVEEYLPPEMQQKD